MAFIALTLSIAIAALGAVGLVVPAVLLAISRPFLSTTGLYLALSATEPPQPSESVGAALP